MTGFTPFPVILTLTHSLIFGTAPKQHMDWSRMIRSSVTKPPSTLSGSMNPLSAIRLPLKSLTDCGIWLSPLSVSGFGLVSSGTSYLNADNLSNPTTVNSAPDASLLGAILAFTEDSAARAGTLENKPRQAPAETIATLRATGRRKIRINPPEFMVGTVQDFGALGKTRTSANR